MILCIYLDQCGAQLISQVSASEGDEMELVVQGLCAFLLGLCLLHNNDQITGYTKYDTVTSF